MGRRRKVPSLGIEEIIARYGAGESLFDVGLAAGLSASGVKDLLLKAGVVLRQRGGPRGPARNYLLGWKARS